ncbi:isochorismatase family cysteine hydrolase [Bradyrhizobium sp.]|uniref:isochorismatase family cysteine hydrolase n=1 Tax=Bradyrhizobium sp. TaxID=376 RepID=UPI000B20CA32|nr:isochorismatase family cysteine hydrolase [Bradyrhizobium sp.]
MTDHRYRASSTGLILVDPYNDFLSEGGKRWPAVKDVVTDVGLVKNLRRLLEGCRRAGVRVFYAMHHQSEAGQFDDWKTPSKSNVAMRDLALFEKGSWGADIHPELVPKPGDVMARQHWNSSGFANTDLDFLLKQYGIDHIAVAGMAANTCVESTGRYGLELGYHVTYLGDGVATFTREEQDATIRLNYPRVGHAVLRIDEFLARITTPLQVMKV